MTDFENRQGDFKDCGNDRRTRLIRRLIEIITSRTEFRVSVGVNVRDYRTSGWAELFSP